MLWNLLCKNYEMSLNTKVKFQHESSILWSGFSQDSEDFVYLHTDTHTHSHSPMYLLLEVIFCGYRSFNLHMKHYFTKLFISKDFRHDFSLTCKKFPRVGTERDMLLPQILTNKWSKLLNESGETKERNSYASNRKKESKCWFNQLISF